MRPPSPSPAAPVERSGEMAPRLPAPPQVPGLPLLGNALALARDPVRFWLEAAQSHGSAFRVRIPTAPQGEITVLCGLEANLLAARRGHELFTARPYYRKLTRETGTDNYICALDGPDHRHYRRAVGPALSREALAPFLPAMFEHVAQWGRAKQVGDRIPVMEQLSRLTIDLLSIAAIRTPIGDETFADLGRYAKTFVGSGVAMRPGFLFRMPGYQAAKHRFEGFLRDAIREHREGASEGEIPDLVDAVLAARGPDGCPFSEADQIANAHLPYANGFIYAGRVSAYLLYALLRNPELMERLRREVDAAWTAGPPTAALLRRMPLLGSTIKETYRLFPIAVAVPRTAATTFEFAGHRIQEGTTVFIAVVVPHFDPEVFADPHEFQPDRFLPPRNEHARPGAYSPYGLGRHACLAVGMVETAVAVTVAGLLRTLRFELSPPDYEIRSVLDPVPGPDPKFTLRVAEVRPREPAPEAGTAPISSDDLDLPFEGLELGPEERRQLAERMERRHYGPGVTIVRQGEPADALYVVTSGEVEVWSESAGTERLLAHLGPSSYFGEIGLLQGVPRTATVRSTQDAAGVDVLAIDRETFLELVSEHDLVSEEIAELARRRAISRQLAESLPGMTPEMLSRLGERFERRTIAAGDDIVREGDPADHFFVLARGQAKVVHPVANGAPVEVARLDAGEFFGEIGLLQGGRRTASVVAADEVDVLALDRDGFRAMMDDSAPTNARIAARVAERLARASQS